MGRVTFTATIPSPSGVEPVPLLVVAVLIAIAYWYSDRLATCCPSRRWPGHRTAAFLAGLVTVDLARSLPSPRSRGPTSKPTSSTPPPHDRRPTAVGARRPVDVAAQDGQPPDQGRLAEVPAIRPFTVATNPFFVWLLYSG